MKLTFQEYLTFRKLNVRNLLNEITRSSAPGNSTAIEQKAEAISGLAKPALLVMQGSDEFVAKSFLLLNGMNPPEEYKPRYEAVRAPFDVREIEISKAVLAEIVLKMVEKVGQSNEFIRANSLRSDFLAAADNENRTRYHLSSNVALFDEYQDSTTILAVLSGGDLNDGTLALYKNFDPGDKAIGNGKTDHSGLPMTPLIQTKINLAQFLELQLEKIAPIPSNENVIHSRPIKNDGSRIANFWGSFRALRIMGYVLCLGVCLLFALLIK